MDKLTSQFQKSSQNQQIALIASAVTFLSTFLPWVGASFGVWGKISVNGWHGFGWLTILGSAGFIALWILRTLKVTLPDTFKDEQLWYRIAAGISLAGPILVFVQSGFRFGLMLFGVYVALIGSGVTLFFVLKPGKKGAPAKKK